jgi:transcriptional antiterminator RfaH
MSILPREPSWFPVDLFGEAIAITQTHHTWWVLHTKPRQEKSLARQLVDAEIPFYLPLISRRFRLQGRIMTSHVPLFGGYVFLRGDSEERLTALATRRVVRALAVPDPDKLWCDLRQIQRLISSGAPITPEDRLAPGVFVEIKSGPLAGLKGKIVRTASGGRFVVQVDFIQRGASVLLDDFSLGRVEEEAPFG